MRVLLFATLADATGERELALEDELAPTTVGELERCIRERWPALSGRPFRVAVNRRYGSGGDHVSPGDEIALIPPVSGG